MVCLQWERTFLLKRVTFVKEINWARHHIISVTFQRFLTVKRSPNTKQIPFPVFLLWNSITRPNNKLIPMCGHTMYEKMLHLLLVHKTRTLLFQLFSSPKSTRSAG